MRRALCSITFRARVALFLRAPKKKTRRWERRVQTFLLSEFTVSSMRPGCRSCRPKAVKRFVFLFQPIFFFFFSFLVLRLRSKFNRSLCEFASISVGLRTHSSLGGDDAIVARAMPAAFFLLESLRCCPKRLFHLRSRQALVKATDNNVT